MSDMQMIWQGTDGSLWDLLGGPVRASIGGIKGLAMPSPQDQLKQFALLDGQTLQAWKLPPRPVWIPLKFKDAGELDVENIQRSWWKSLALGETGQLIVTDGSGAVRQIGLRFQGDGDLAYTLSPYILSQPFGLDLIADAPWWLGPPLAFAFSVAAASGSFFGNGAGATPFYIGPFTGQGSQVVQNPGDAPAWPLVTVAGALSAWDVNVDGHHVAGPAVASGDVLTVHTDPQSQYATLLSGGVTTIVTNQLTALDFAAIPKGAGVPVTITAAGAGLVSIGFQPRYSRAL